METAECPIQGRRVKPFGCYYRRLARVDVYNRKTPTEPFGTLRA